MYLFINDFAFKNPKNGILDRDVVEAIGSLGNLFIELRKINVELIIHSTLSQTILNRKPIREYIELLENNNVRQSFRILLNKTRPMCSDINTPYEEDKNILNNCVEKEEKIDVLETFLACAMYYNNPILTVNNLCNKKQFFKDKVNIVCDDSQFELINYKLIPYEEVLLQIKAHQKNELLDQLNNIDNWNDYKDFVNNHFDYCKITDYCLECLSRKFSYKDSYGVQVRKKILRMNTEVKQNNGQIMTMPFPTLGLGTPESETRFKALKESDQGIRDYKNNDVNLNWHDYIQKDFRIYFEKNTEFISFVYFEKKIS